MQPPSWFAIQIDRMLRIAFVLAMGVVASCSKSAPDPLQPVASLARSVQSQAAFQGLRERWLMGTPAERALIEPELRSFRAQFADDPLARVADAYLAFLALQRGDFANAERIASSVAGGPAGNTRDVAVLVRGALLSKTGRPEEALRMLEPLDGKLLDGFGAPLLYEAMADAAVQSQRWDTAIRALNAWIRDSDRSERPALRVQIDRVLDRFPAAAAENALNDMLAEPRPDAWERDMIVVVTNHVGAIAVQRSDARLARSVLETSRTVGGLDSANSDVEELASRGARVPSVSRRTVGMVLPLSDPRQRQRAVLALGGAMDVFDPSVTSAAASAAGLRTRTVGAELEEVITALDALAQQGASLAIAGFDSESASAAAGWAEAEAMPVILLVAPSRMPLDASFTFVLGEDDAALVASTEAAAKARGEAAMVVGGIVEDDPLIAGCGSVASRAGEGRFPMGAWKARKVGAVGVAGPPECAAEVMQELEAVGFHPEVVLGLEALGARIPANHAGAVIQALAGRLGSVAATSSDDPSLAAWRGKHGAGPGWFAALGRDAAALASIALAGLPLDETTDAAEVARRRVAVQRALAGASGLLWTTGAAGFGGGRQLGREIRYERGGK